MSPSAREEKGGQKADACPHVHVVSLWVLVTSGLCPAELCWFTLVVGAISSTFSLYSPPPLCLALCVCVSVSVCVRAK